jgi:hypothetical protein
MMKYAVERSMKPTTLHRNPSSGVKQCLRPAYLTAGFKVAIAPLILYQVSQR